MVSVYSHIVNTPARKLQVAGVGTMKGPWRLVSSGDVLQGYVHEESRVFVPIGNVIFANHSEEPS